MTPNTLLTSTLCAPALVFVQPPGLVYAEDYLSVEEALELAFPEADSFERKRRALTGAKRTALDEVLRKRSAPRLFSYHEARRGEEVLGYAIVDNVLGKSQPITYMLALRPDLTVSGVELLVYRESHGWEIRRPVWRSQFEDKSIESPLRVRRDVTNIAGATISCNSIADGVHDVLRLMHELVEPTEAEVRPAESEASVLPATGIADATTGPLQRTRMAMGTSLAVTLAGAPRHELVAASEALFAEVERLEGLLSLYRADSELSRLNASAGGDWVPLSADTLAVLRRAKELARETGGAFDPTAQPLQRLWRDARAGAAPSSAQLEVTRALVSWEALEFDGTRARLRRPGASLDLGGVGKGYALDRARELLRARGLESALLNFGGNILALDPPAGERGWRVELRDPSAADAEAPPLVLELANAALATSADYERGIELRDGSVSHIVDPRTGQPARGCAGVSVLCEDATRADALSTALFVMGPENARRFADEGALEAWIVPTDGEPWMAPQLSARRVLTPHEAGAPLSVGLRLPD